MHILLACCRNGSGKLLPYRATYFFKTCFTPTSNTCVSHHPDNARLIVRCVYSVPIIFGVPMNLAPAAASMQAQCGVARASLL